MAEFFARVPRMPLRAGARRPGLLVITLLGALMFTVLPGTPSATAVGTVPGAPTGVTAVPQSGGAVLVTWKAPVSDGGSEITDYAVSATSAPHSSVTTCGAATTSCLVSDVYGGTAYAFKVQAVNDNGAGNLSSPATATPIDRVPGKVTDLSGTRAPNSGQVVLTWRAPAFNGASAVQRYQVSRDNGTFTELGAITPNAQTGLYSYAVGALTNGQAYTFRVRGRNATGTGPEDTVTATPDLLPAAVQVLTATAADTSATLTWKAPVANTGSAVTGYQVLVGSGSWTDASVTADANGVFTYGVPNLTTGTPVAIQVRAVNQVGGGTATSKSVTPDRAPGAVQGLAATAPSSGQLKLTWTAPVANGGTAVTRYEYQLDGATSWTSVAKNLLVTIGGLTNGQTYTYWVRPVNAVNSGPAASVTATADVAPAAPRSVTATPGDKSIALRWLPPLPATSNPGTPVTGYEYAVSGQSTWTPLTQVTTDADGYLSSTATGLANGTGYTLVLRAVNGRGGGSTSYTNPQIVTPNATAGAVQNLKVTYTGVQGSPVTIDWAAPGDSGSSVTGYQFRILGNDPNINTDWSTTGDGLATSKTWPLNPGYDYDFQVRAVSQGGVGPGASVAVHPDGQPMPVANMVATSGDASGSVTFDAPLNAWPWAGSAPVRYEYKLDDADTWTSNGLGQTITFDNLVNKRTYVVHVRAINKGVVPGFEQTRGITPRTTPGAVQNLAFNSAQVAHRAVISWNAPLDDGGALVSYEYKVVDGDWIDPHSQGTQIDNLDYNKDYPVSVRAYNVAGRGPSESITVRLKQTLLPPGPVVNLKSVPGALNTALVLWEQPAATQFPVNGGQPVTGYEYKWADEQAWAPTPTTVPVLQLDDLTAGVERTLMVRAVNSDGAGPATNIAVSPINQPPAAVNDLKATASSKTATLDWKAPTPNGGSAITGYQYKRDGAATWSDLGTQRSVDLSGLTNGQSYTYAVRAVNAAGGGEESNVELTPFTTPGPVRDLEATFDDASTTVTWKAPSDNGGSALIGYEYQLDGETTWHGVGSGTSQRITDLVNGVKRTIRVRAVNAAGDGPAESVDARPNVVPGGVTNVQSTNDDMAGSFTFDPPEDNGGTPVLGYEYQISGADTWIDLGSTRKVVLDSLTNGSRYYYSIRAYNAAGKGASAGSVIAPYREPRAPGALRDFKVTPGDGTLTVTFKRPLDEGSEPIKNWHIQISPQWINAFGHEDLQPGESQTFVYSGLTNGFQYYVDAWAWNNSSPSTSDGSHSNVAAMPNAAPKAVQSLSVVPGDGSGEVTWTAPISNSLTPLQGYEYKLDRQSSWTSVGTLLSAQLTDLTNGAERTLTVRAVSAAGDGDETSVNFTPRQTVAPATVPGSVVALQAVQGDRSSTVTWRAPVSDGGSAVTKYLVKVGGADAVEVSGPAVNGLFSYTASGLTNGTSYDVVVRAVNAVGAGESASTTVKPTKPPVPAKPGVPFSVQGVGGDRTLTVTWMPPATAGSSPVTRYGVSIDGGKTWASVPAAGAGQQSKLFEGVYKGRSYPVRVVAVNDVGPGTVSAQISVPVVQWFADPLSTLQRAGLVSVPVAPASYKGPIASTVWNSRSSAGTPVMGFDQLGGRQLQYGEATSLLGDPMFDWNTTNLTSKGRAQLVSLAHSLRYVTAVTCEGYADYGGSSANARALAVNRATLVCSMLKTDGIKATTTIKGYSHDRPIVIGGTADDRAANRRVIVVATKG